MSVVKQNFHSECEGDVNKLINLKLTASYTYLALVTLKRLTAVLVFSISPAPQSINSAFAFSSGDVL